MARSATAATDLRFHEAAAIFPLMRGAEYEALKADIRANGLKHPIVMCDGLILDGRNRYRACKDTDVSVRTVEWDGKGSPIAYVLSTNIHRRSLLTTSQRAMAGAHPLTFEHFQEEAAKRKEKGQKEGGRGHKKTCRSKDREVYLGEATGSVGAVMKVSASCIKRARQVHEKGSCKMIEAVAITCALSVNAAGVVAGNRTKAQQDELLKQGFDVVRKLAMNLNSRRPRSRKGIPELVTSMLKDLERLLRQVEKSTKGLAAQRERATEELRLSRKRIKEACHFLI